MDRALEAYVDYTSIVKGSAYEPTPWRAVQRAAWEALARGTDGE